MKWFIYTLMVIAIGLIVYNCMQVDFSNPFVGDSLVAVITILSGLCAILLLAILLTSRKIKQTLRNKS